jgi:hopanoid biosynthesis associated RND transporter like protein HpnN
LDDLGSFADHMVDDLEKLSKELSKTDDQNNSTIKKTDDSPVDQLERQLLLNTYISLDQGKMLLMLVTPDNGDPNSFSPHEFVISSLRNIAKDIKSAYPEIKVGITGEPVLMDDELRQSTQDMIWASILTFILISCMFFYAYRSFWRPVLVLITIVSALFCSIGLAVITVGHLNIISQAFGLMLLGLGVDLGIQILGRYEECRSHGKPVQDALQTALSHTGIPVITGGGTTAVAFYTMCFNDFIGLAELGLIAGSGMVICIIWNLTLLPALIALRDRNRTETYSKLHLDRFAKGKKLDQKLISHPKFILTAAGIITIAAATQIPKISFDYNLLHLQNPKLESVQYINRLMKESAQGFLYGVVITDNLDDAAAKTKELLALPTVASVNSPLSVFPEDQDEKLKILKDVRTELNQIKFDPNKAGKIDVASARVDLEKILNYSVQGEVEAKKFLQAKDKRASQAFEIFKRLIPALQNIVSKLQTLSQEDATVRLNRFQIDLLRRMQQDFDFLKQFDMENAVTLDDVPPEIKQRYISPNGKVALEVVPKVNIWDRDQNEKFVKDLRTISPEATGTPVQNYTYLEVLRKSYLQAALWAFVAIVIMVTLHFTSIRWMLFTLLPLTIGITWTLGFMGAFHIQFNPANIITLPLAIGIGVAYGIYIIDRYREENQMTLFASSTGKAILLSALTAFFGFSAMMIGQYQGLRSLGMVMGIAIIMCLLASLIILPQCLCNRRGNKSK